VRTFAGTTVRLIVFFAIAVALISVPLLIVYRSECREDGGRENRWTFVAPWDDPPGECRNHDNGFQVIRDEVGLD
jgi:hypothetical protein